MTLEEIFKTNPDLLKEPEVQNLLKYVREKHDDLVDLHKKYRSFYLNVNDLFIYSELMIIQGEPSKTTLKKIGNLLQRFIR